MPGFPRRLLLGAMIAAPGCEVVFPLREPEAAPPMSCPEDSSALAFGSSLTKILDAHCFAYSESPLADLAVCSDLTSEMVEGPIGMPPIQATFSPPFVGVTLFSANIHPEGDQLTALSYKETTQVSTIEVFRRQGVTWTSAATSPAVGGGAVMGIPSRGPNARMLVHDPNRSELVELVQQADATWNVETVSTLDALGEVRPVNSIMNLTPDGLRVVFKATIDGKIGYAHRATVTDAFRAASLIDAPAHEAAPWVFLTENCDQLIGAATVEIGGVFVAPRR